MIGYERNEVGRKTLLSSFQLLSLSRGKIITL
jgi:hypothetical protein